MRNFILCTCLFRLVLPLLLTTCIVFRPSFISAIYLLFLLYAPFVPVPTAHSMKGHAGRYFTLLTAITVLAFLCQLSFQIVLLAIPPYAHFLKNCEFLEKILRHAGLVHMESLSAVSVATWLAPEILASLSSIVLFVACAKLTSGAITADGAADPVLEDGIETPLSQRAAGKNGRGKGSGKGFKLFVAMGRYLVLALLCCAAVLRPSVQGGVYFLCFLASATWWSCYREMRKGFAYLLRLIMLLVFAHISCLYAYQFQWPQEMLEGNSTYARYFGLTPLMSVDCGEPRDFIWADVEWASYFNPLLLIWLYYTLAIESKQLLKPQSQRKQGAFSRLETNFSAHGRLSRQVSERLSASSRRLKRSSTTKNRWQSATRKVRVSLHKSHQHLLAETTPLMRGVSPSQRYGSGDRPKSGPTVLQDSTGSVIVSTENPDEIQMKEIEDEEKSSLFENIIGGLESILQFIIQTSYIATNIIMMAWSITYHSWITFLLLLWASILWMVPNQRKSMLRCSPFLVFYAWFLLISAYIYSMDLTDEELPSIIYGIDMSQVGFIKNVNLPCKQLAAKCLYTVMFWITLRQYMKERQIARQSNTLADMVAPLQVSVGAATGMTNERTDSGVRVMERVGQVVQASLTKFWIWIVASTLFAVAITGDRMTGFRILYMALFLFFILSFQLSFRFWRKVMFAFWLTVIIYSMIILVMVYTYQFNNFDTYWADYLHVDKEQQRDIGLEKYETKQLFVRLVTPTFFVIIAVIQLHYFHRDFMTMTDPRRRPTIIDGTSGGAVAAGSVLEGGATRSEANSSAQGGLVGVASSVGSSGVVRAADAVDSDEEDDTGGKRNSVKLDLTDIGNVSSAQLQAKFAVHLAQLQRYLNLVLLFLELHMPKWVLGAAMIVCVYDRCAIYLLIVAMVVVGACCSRHIQMAAIYGSSVLVSALLLARMLYQIKYVEHGTWNVTCEFENATSELHNVTVNNAEWLGFSKMANGRDLPKLVRWNIAYILVVTVLTIVMVRQANYRTSRGKSPTQRPFFMFPKVKRSDADKDLMHCIKYLLNYGYYKFGVEASLMATCALIGFRMDMYALFYAIWLCIILGMERNKLATIWNVYLFFIAFFIPLQYIMSIGLPPGLCIEYPWDDSEMLRRVQEWAYLIDSQYPPSPKKLLCDFVLLLFVARQSVVFRIERRYAARPYPGGDNDSIIHNAEQKGFVLPVPDFITYVWSYLDIVKRGVLLSFMWITLAIVFLAGTNRVSLFSIGYLIGSFFFLWQGSDIYLRPIPKILKSWNVLLGYNVSVILIKTFLQLVGCIFIADVQEHACWLVQLLGIGCVRKFKNPVTLAGIIDPNECSVPREYIGLAWDGVCFGFLLVQRRIFNSYNFFHMVDDTKASAILASRGAELIDELKLKRMREQDEQERRILEKIKAKMDRIKANQQKIQGPSKEPSTHYVAQPPLARSPSLTSTTTCTSTSHHTTARSSPNGYHTPIDDYDDDYHPELTATTNDLEQPQQQRGHEITRASPGRRPLPVTRTSSLMTHSTLGGVNGGGPSSPYSALYETGGEEGYMEPARISFSSPPSSELDPSHPDYRPNRATSPEDSFPVFSPPPYSVAMAATALSATATTTDDSGATTTAIPRDIAREATVRDEAVVRERGHQRQVSLGPPWTIGIGQLVTPSVLSYAGSRSPMSHHTYSIFPSSNRPQFRKNRAKFYKQAVRSGDYYMFDELDDDDDLDMEDMKPNDEEGQDRLRRRSSKKRTIGELLSSAMKTNIGVTLRTTNRELQRHLQLQRRASMPLSRQRSVVSARSQLSAPLSAPPTIEEHVAEKVVIKDDKKDKEDDFKRQPQPGTSKDEDISDFSESKRESKCQTILNYILFLWAFIDSAMISATNYLNRYTKDYRYVLRVLTKEKKLLKETTEYNVGIRVGSNQVWQPTGSYHSLLANSRIDLLRTSAESDVRQPVVRQQDSIAGSDTKPLTLSPNGANRSKASVLTIPEIRILAPSLERGLDSPDGYSLKIYPHHASPHHQRVDIAEEYDTTELSSYDQPTIIRLMLAAWYIVLSHSDILCYLVIFLNQIKSATFLSLPLPLMVFFWGTLTIPRPSKTFWVTIIAYTQVIVLIKCVFQFEFFPWNAVPILNPFDAPRIIGIEQKNNYAVWDLLLLLIIFFHRFMLKCMGLWKTEFAVPTVVLPEGEYKVENGQIIPVVHKENEKSILSPPNIRSSSAVRSSPLHHQESDLQRLVEESEDGAEDEPSTNSLVDSSGGGVGGGAAAGHSTSADSSISPRHLSGDGVGTTAAAVGSGFGSSGSGRGTTGGGDGQLVSEGRGDDSGGELVRAENNEMTAMELFPGAIQLSTSKYTETAKEFFQQLADPTSRVAADVYSYMFMCDFFNFFVILLGYSAFGAQQGDGGVSSYLEDNRVPVLFLLMLILQFLLIIIDRAIFLRKNIVGKIVFQFIQIFILHVWLFILFPAMTERSFNSVLPPQMYYMVKCFYLLLSGYQIRCGYPSRILGNFLCKGYNYLNMFLFKGFMFIPFLFELRTVMDWMWTDTSMTVMDWIKMEDIFAHIFQLKCSRHVESEYPQPRGEKKKPNIKYLMGGGLLAIIIAVIWFPLVFFSLGNAVGEPNPPYDITLDLRIGPYEPIYRMSAQTNSIFQFKENDYNALLNKYTSSKNKVATTFISNYEPGDIVAVKLSGDSASIWSISPPDMERMLDELNSTNPISVRLQYQVSHHSNTKEDPGVMREEQIVTLDALVDGKPNPARQNLLLMLTANATDVPPIPLSYIIPKFIKVTNRATAKPIVQLMEPNPVPVAQSMRNITIKLQSTPDRKDRVWWELQEDCGDYNYLRYLKNIPYADCNFLMLYAFNDKIFPSTLNIITGGGIIGLYTTLVFVASRVLRGFFSEICFKIMFDDMPNVDRVLQLCLDIYLVREAAEFCLEEDLFAKLVFLFRSPETLIKWTREKEDDDGEDDGDEED